MSFYPRQRLSLQSDAAARKGEKQALRHPREGGERPTRRVWTGSCGVWGAGSGKIGGPPPLGVTLAKRADPPRDAGW
jgi:hypothetical protein